MVTVFTSTYNRAYTLGRLYQSLKEQTSSDLEWIIIDDGSTDQTEDLVRSWMAKTERFSIHYKKVPNGGKHRAINLGTMMACSEAFFIVDSDDFLAEDAIDFINKMFPEIAGNDGYAGISGLKAYEDGNVIGGHPAFTDYVDATNFEREQYGLLNDKAEVYKTSVLKRFPFPEYPGENFMGEDVVWNAIAFAGLKIRWFNKTIYYAEYLADGLSRNSYMKCKQNPYGWAELIRREKKYGKINEEQLLRMQLKFVERVALPEDTVCSLLNITKKDYEGFCRRKERFAAAIKKELRSHDITKMALYGYGRNAKRLMEYLDGTGVDIIYVIDRNYKNIKDMKAYSLQMELPPTDAVCITLEKPEEKIREELRHRLPNSYIWQIKDLETDIKSNFFLSDND